jgi:adenylate kinase
VRTRPGGSSMRVLIMGPPGAGSSTQAAYLAHHLGVPAICAGDVFTAHLSARTQLGLHAKAYVDAGVEVPDRVASEMTRNRLVQQDARHGWVLHDYPLTLAQVGALDELCGNCGHTLDAVIFLGVPETLLVSRLLHDGSGDGVEAIESRLRAYGDRIQPVMSAYLRRGILQVVDGRGSDSEVRQRCIAAVAAAQSRAALV